MHDRRHGSVLPAIALTLCALVMTPAAAMPQPVLSIPLNGSFVETTTPALLWEKLDNANVYVVSVFADRKGVRRIAKLTVRGNSCPVPEGHLKRGQRYWWNVAPSRSGILDKPSTMWSFTVRPKEARGRKLPEEDYHPQILKTESGEKTGNADDLIRSSSASAVHKESPARKTGRPAASQEKSAAGPVWLIAK